MSALHVHRRNILLGLGVVYVRFGDGTIAVVPYGKTAHPCRGAQCAPVGEHCSPLQNVAKISKGLKPSDSMGVGAKPRGSMHFR